MGIWFSEQHTKNLKLSVKIKEQLYSKKSYYQLIEVFDTEEFGRMLVLDECVMITEKDEFMYHEMIAHVPMAANPDAKNVLIIGGGDGGAVRELLRYKTIEHIDMVEIDSEVVDVCCKYIPQTAAMLDDARLSIHYEDGLAFVRKTKNTYDLIIVDSTDPFGPGEGLFTREFYGNCYKALSDNGILINQHESTFYDEYAQAFKNTHKKLSKVFPNASVYSFQMPTYPSGIWYFGFASKGIDPIKDLDEEAWNDLKIKTRYYNTDIHKAAFVLPNYVKELLDE